jgi:hypothetical protein
MTGWGKALLGLGFGSLVVSAIAPLVLHDRVVIEPIPKGMRAISAAPAFLAGVGSAYLPKDVARALVVPKGARATSTSDGIGSYFERQVDYDISFPQAKVAAFFPAVLKQRGWHLLSTTSGRIDTVIATLGSSDGWTWEIGVRISPAKGGLTPFSVQIQQMQEPD